jgi:adenosylmethionine-8-amino-7-oxononanoate aminotransferase
LVEALQKQAAKLSHVMFGGITHEPAIQLGKALHKILPKGLNKIFYADSGSVSIEVALKMAIQYQVAMEKGHKTLFLTFKGGYHGDTTGAMSVCDPVNGMHTLFGNYLPEHYFLERPAVAFDSELPPGQTEYDRLKKGFESHAKDCAAFILEPVVQGAGGMWIYHPQYLSWIRELCDEHQILLIADEIATGFGRTGKFFACEHSPIVPDILCIGKALAGGMMTFAACIAHEKVAEVISNSEVSVIMHGPTYMGNPLACSVALASLKLLQETDWLQKVNSIEHTLSRCLTEAKAHPIVKRVSILGAIGVIETTVPIDVAKIQKYFVAQGVWIRPFGRLLYIMPPYNIPEKDLTYLCTVMVESLDKLV